MSKTFKKLCVVEKSADFRRAVRVVESPLVPPQDDQVLLKVIYAGVNATDINITAARYFASETLPFDIGLEALGTIQAVGKNVTQLKVGEPAIYYAADGQLCRAYSEYLYLKPDEVVPVPVLKPELLALLICGITASMGLDEMGRIQPGDKVLITASAGGTGHIAVQWAKQKGCYVIGMTSSKEKAKLLKELGTDRVINYKTENLDEVLTKEFPSGIDVIWETIGGQVFETLFKHLAVMGRFVIIGGISGYKDVGFPQVTLPNIQTTLLLNNQSLNGFLIFNRQDLHQKYLKQLIADHLSNRLKVVLDMGQTKPEGSFHGINSVVRGVEHLHSTFSTGKVVIKIQDE